MTDKDLREELRRQEIEEKQRKRLGDTVKDYLAEDDDFENVDTDSKGLGKTQDFSTGEIKIALHDYDDDAFSLGHNYDEAEAEEYKRRVEEELQKLSPQEQRARRREIKAKLINGKKIHRDIMVATYFFVLLFVGIIAYLGYFTYAKSDEYKQNEYNSKRQSVYADRYIRGDIVSADGELLATTETDEDGNETRSYPQANKYAHAVGYSTKGNTGVESIANSYLLGSHINLVEQATDEITDTKIQGDTVVTTLNSKLQDTAYEALGDNKGAVIVMEVKTGKILAMVSKPDYNPNKINEIWDELVSDETNSNLVNRATQGLYPPGSTFKILTLLEYVRENPSSYQNFSFECDSKYEVEDYTIKCSKGKSHGELTLKKAFAKSCNGAFAKIGETLDVKQYYELCEEMGYNSKIDTEVLSSASKFNLTTETADLWARIQTAIGQGKTTTTPLQNLLVTCAVANGGTMMQPYIVDSVKTADGSTVKTFSSTSLKKVMTASEASLIGEYMRAVVTDGTGSSAEGDSYTVAGKTGSAEWKTGEDTHAWFVGYAPYENPEIAIAVICENAGSGGSVAAPIAKEVFDTYFED